MCCSTFFALENGQIIRSPVQVLSCIHDLAKRPVPRAAVSNRPRMQRDITGAIDRNQQRLACMIEVSPDRLALTSVSVAQLADQFDTLGSYALFPRSGAM